MNFRMQISKLKKNLINARHGTIYSATTFLESCRKVVREIWFEKAAGLNLKFEMSVLSDLGGLRLL